MNSIRWWFHARAGSSAIASGHRQKDFKILRSTVRWGDSGGSDQAGDEAGMEQLYKVFRGGVRYYLGRQLGPQELEGRLHDTFLIIVNAIKRGDIREPNRLMSSVRTVVRRQVAADIEEADKSHRDEINLEGGVTVADRAQNPEQQAIIRQSADLIQSSLSALSEKDREVLVRFYWHDQPGSQNRVPKQR